MFKRDPLIRGCTVGRVATLAAAALFLLSTPPALACGGKRAKAAERDVVTQLAGDRQVEAELNARLAELEARLRELEHELNALSETLERLHGRDAGRSHRRHVPIPPTPVPPPEAYGEAREMYRDAREQWREHRDQWREHQRELTEEWREHQQEWAEHWREQMEEWREYQEEAAGHWREQLEELREHGGDWTEGFEVPEFDMPEIIVPGIEIPEIEIAEIELHGVPAAAHEYPFGEGERHRLVYEVTGKHADWLYKLLAPSDVKVIVSRAGKHIGVRGTDCEHKVLRAALELLNWIERDDAFDWMTEGQRHAKRYELGAKRAEMMFDMLAPGDVKVIVSRAGDDAVSVQATDREHKVLSNFLILLNWRADHHPAPKAAHEKALKKAKELQKKAEQAKKRARMEHEKQRAATRKDARKAIVYDVTGDHADWLYKLLAPSDVKVIVSRAGKHIAVSGTDYEHKVLRGALELLNWIGRDDAFDWMTEGERHAKRYELGPKRAEMMFDMLAPGDVKVIVSRAGDDAVSVQATDREHKVLSNFLILLNWSADHHRGPKAAHEKALKKAKELQKKAEQAKKRARMEHEKQRAATKKDARKAIVYGVTGDHADWLYKLLAPDYVKVIVSRAGENIRVQGTKGEHAVLNAGLQLLNWIDRDEVFEKMTDGQRFPRTYELGEQRAGYLFKMLAPNDVKVIVSRISETAVAVQGTKREHKVLSSFLELLGWTEKGEHPFPKARAKVTKPPKTPKPPKAEKAERQVERVVYDVTGKHADMLYKLLAPDDVKAVVSREGEKIAVRGTKFELKSICAFLQLVNWSKRGDAFEKMTEGERSPRLYRLGEKRADLMYDMLAPNDVLVIVGRAGPDAVTIAATEREHKVLRDFLKVLHWEVKTGQPEA